MVNLVTFPACLKRIFPQLVWEIDTDEKDVYLTFDDGPSPVVTSIVLSCLEQVGAKATFFCLGSQIIQNQSLFSAIKDGGHMIGNHGYNHLSGFGTSIQKYLENARLGEQISGSRLFRPPYGRMTPRQIKYLRNDYKLIMWSIMSMDYNRQLTPEKCFDNVVKNIKPGSIIVFHDNEKAAQNLKIVLPKLLDWLAIRGFQMKALEFK